MSELTPFINDRPEEFLLESQKYLKETIAPQAATLDSEPQALQKALLSIGKLNWLALRFPTDCGGLGLSDEAFYRFQILMARYSGALCFLQTQHQAAGMQLMKSVNQPLKQSYLLHLANGKKLIGVGFSQLRRRGEALTKAVPIQGGYLLNGIVPWVTGWDIFQDFIVGATLPTGEAVYGIVPLKNIPQDKGGTLRVTQPLALAAMSSTNTVSVTVEDWFLPQELVISVQPVGAIHDNDRHNVLYHGFFALGCAWGGLDILEVASHKKQLPFLLKAFHDCQLQVNRLQEQMLATVASPTSYEEKLELRVQAIILAGKCAQAAVTACSGEANLLSHPAQRVYREALMLSVSGQTTAVMQATLEKLFSQSL